MKRCPCCKEIKLFAEFYGTVKASCYCRLCTKLKQDEWWKSNKVRKAEINRGWRKRNPERRKLLQKTSNAVWKAIKEGRLIRGAKCEKCGSHIGIEAAHHDYTKPLDVKWLCRSCHRQWDAESPKSLHC